MPYQNFEDNSTTTILRRTEDGRRGMTNIVIISEGVRGKTIRHNAHTEAWWASSDDNTKRSFRLKVLFP